MNINILPADTYIVVNKTILSPEEHNLLIMLYQPIIGSSAVSLYLTLWSYLDRQALTSKEWTHHHLMLSMREKLAVITDAKDKLEAIGLIKSYVKKGDINNFIYELYSPLSAADFFTNPILATSLFNNVGKSDYERIANFFRIPKMSLVDYEDITHSFTDIFVSSPFTPIEKLADDIRKNNKRDLEFSNQLDLDNMMALIPDEVLNKKGITKEMREIIIKLAVIYNLSEDIMRDIIRNSINDKHSIDKDKLKTNSRNYYKFEHGGKLPSVMFKNQPENMRSSNEVVSKKAKLVYQFETCSPYDFLTLKNGGNRPTKTDLSLLEELLVDYNMNPGVANVLIDYALRINNNKLSKPYVMAIASQWIRSNIKTVEEAMSFAEKEQSKKKKPTTYKKKTEALKPDWLDKDIEQDVATKEEKDRFEQLLKNFK